MPLTRLAAVAGAAAPPGAADVAVQGITLRAQHVRPGDLFAALPGTRVHGAAFADDARQAGAVAVLTDAAGAAAVATRDAADGADRADGAGGAAALPVLVCPDVRAVLGDVAAAVYGDPSRRLAVLGVTGTSGKTTTCYLLEAALQAGGDPVGLIGTVQTRIGGQASPSALTTPEAPDLQALFAVMAEQGARAVAMEVSSHSLELGRVAGTRFAVGAFTNLSQDHLDFHPDMESYFRAKSLLFDGRSDRAVVDVDGPYGRRLAATVPGAVTVSGTGSTPADWSLAELRPVAGGTQQLCIRRPDGPVLDVSLALPGPFNAANAVLALACVARSGTGVDVDAAARALATVVVPGRMERVDAGQPFLAVVDYAHKPAALEAVLEAVGAGLTGRLIVVVGAGGDRDRGKRPLMGAAVAAWADLVVVTDDNPRSESPAAIRAAVLAGTRGAMRRRPGQADVREVGDRHEAIRAAVAAARAGDVVVVAGKGHETGQEVAGVVHEFSDRDEVRAALAGRGFDAGHDGTAA
nr:UDP-N-acetylmuramoyl-L-alanyl-D-glutamate--2,6-diaminopimelate ligase [Nakamurella endophytica]